MLTRRHFLQTSCTVGAASAFWKPGQAAADDEFVGPGRQPDVVSYQGSYPGWPWTTSGTDGTLYCVFREGTMHDYSAEGRLIVDYEIRERKGRIAGYFVKFPTDC